MCVCIAEFELMMEVADESQLRQRMGKPPVTDTVLEEPDEPAQVTQQQWRTSDYWS